MKIKDIITKIKKSRLFKSKLVTFILKVLKRFHDLTQYYDISIFASSIVFNLLTVFVPLFMIFSSLLSSLFEFNQGFLAKYLSSDVMDIINSLIITKMPKGMTGFAAALFVVNLIWITSKFMGTLNRISDLVYVEVEDRPSLKLRIRSFVMMFFAIIFMFVDFVGSVILSYVISYLYKTSVIHHKFMNIIFLNVLPFVINFLAIAIFVIVLYKYLIPIKIRFKKVFASAFLVTIAWYVLTFALRISFGLSKNTPVIYGTFSNIYMILVWLYSVSFVFILGIILNYYLYLKAGKKSEE